MQDGCKVYINGHLHGIKLITFHGHLDYFQKPPLGGRPNTKSGDYGNPELSQLSDYSSLPCMKTRMNRNCLKQHLVKGPVTYDFTLRKRIRDHTT
jgi:hypothetical protein